MIAFLFLLSCALYGSELTHTSKKVNDKMQQISLQFTLKPGEYLYKESLVITANNPAVRLTPALPSVHRSHFLIPRQKNNDSGTKTQSPFPLLLKNKELPHLKKHSSIPSIAQIQMLGPSMRVSIFPLISPAHKSRLLLFHCLFHKKQHNLLLPVSRHSPHW